MRILLVGPPADRARLRPELEDAGLEIIGEFASLPPESSRNDADAVVLTSSASLASPRHLNALDADSGEVVEPLTPREREVLNLMAEGLPNKAIAQRLGISDQTVKFHVSSIGGKLGAANRTEAVRRAVRRGLITL